MENPDNLKWKSDEPEKKSFIDRKKIHESILKDDILVSMRMRSAGDFNF